MTNLQVDRSHTLVIANLLACNSIAAHARQLDSTIRALRSSFQEVYAICAVEGCEKTGTLAQLSRDYAAQGIRLYGFPLWSKPLRLLYLLMVLSWLRLKLWLRRRDALLFTRSTYIGALATLFGWRVSVELHEMPCMDSVPARWLHRLMFNRANNIVCISPGIRQQLLRENGGLSELSNRIVVAPLGLSKVTASSLQGARADVCHSCIAEWAAACSHNKLLYTGSLHKLDSEEFSRFICQFEDVVLLVIGGNERQWTEVVTRRGVVDHVGIRLFHIPHTRDESVLEQAREIAEAFLLTNPKTLKYARYTSPLKLFEYARKEKPVFLIGLSDFLDGLRHTEGIINLGMMNTNLDVCLASLIRDNKDSAQAAFRRFCYLYSSENRIRTISNGLLQSVKGN